MSNYEIHSADGVTPRVGYSSDEGKDEKTYLDAEVCICRGKSEDG
jgi:hypothetical protein